MVREMADELYIKRVLMVLVDFLFFSLYSFSCIASSSTTLKDILILVLSIRTSSSVPQHPYHLRPTPPVTVDAHFQNWAVTVSLSFLPIKDGNMMVM